MSWRTDRQKDHQNRGSVYGRRDHGRSHAGQVAGAGDTQVTPYEYPDPYWQNDQYPAKMLATSTQSILGATFTPGGSDDYYMPDVISPLPQRVMPEVPSNMQDGLAHLELEARGPQESGRRSAQSAVSVNSMGTEHNTNRIFTQEPRGFTADYEHTNAQAYQDTYVNGVNHRSSTQPSSLPSQRIASAFPTLSGVGPNVPPSDEEKEEVLEEARSLVLNSNDPEMQLAWAQDALLWVETAVGNRMREAGGPGRSTTPTVEHQLRVDAISIVNFLAEQQHPKAVFLKGTWHEFGKFGYPLDKHESIRLYRIAADKGFPRAEYRIGTQYEALGDMHRAVKHYSRGAAADDSASTYRIGMMTLLGQHGQQKSYQKGIEQIKFAANYADENAPQGAYVYGMLLARELPNITIPDMFMPVDIDQAKQYIEKAAYLGFAKAQQKMGEAYELCLLSCEFNPALSLHYNALAAKQGDPAADMAISKWFLCGYEGVFAKNEKLAFQYAERAAIAGLSTAEFAMGYFFEIGMYVVKDIEHAKEWYQKAEENGNKDAIVRLQSISQHSVLNKTDHEQSAINRIRSQYGSKKGVRPDRLNLQQPPLPPMPEAVSTSITAASPKVQHNSQSHSLLTPNHRDRTSSAPYPENDVVYKPQHRVQSLRPAPLADRPSSAFGIRPLVSDHSHQTRSSTMSPSTNMGHAYPKSGYQGAQVRPHGAPAGGLDGAGRQISPNRGPLSQQHNHTGQPAPLNRQNRAGSWNATGNQVVSHSVPVLQQPSTGFSARPQRNGGSPPRKPAPGSSQLPQQHPGKSPDESENRPSSAVQSLPSQSRPHTATTDQANFGANQVASVPMNNTMSIRRPIQLVDNPASTTSVTSAPTAAAPSRPAGGGPKTFDEMGIPHTKDQGECVSCQILHIQSHGDTYH